MFVRISRSWGLVKASAAVLSQDKALLLFPLMSLGALFFVCASFALPVFGLGLLDGISGGGRGTISAGLYATGFLFYFAQFFVIFFFNAALVGAAMMRLDGGDPTLADGLRIATSKIGAIAGYALIAATVGVVLRAIQERVGFIGRIIVGLLGVGWAIATYLVVPVLVARDVGPVDAVKESAALLKKTWGENVIGQVGLSAAFGFIFLGVIVCAIALVLAAFASQSIFLIVAAFVVTIIAIGTTGLVQSALTGIYAAALYRYATTGESTQGFDAAALKLAFAPK
ncbi:MAG: DUF6159 family protein [Usitatibacter sp.]